MTNQPELQPSELVSNLMNLLTDEKRVMIAIAGPPASGKSTLADRLSIEINTLVGNDVAVVVPMDGFHFDNKVLDAREQRAIKGAPETFDIYGLLAMLQRLLGDTHDIAIPLFDRELDAARAGARIVTAEQRLILVEGNYLLLDSSPWSMLSTLFDYRIYIDIPEKLLEKRLMQRWLDHDHGHEDARFRTDANDLPNARLVAANRLAADYIVTHTQKRD